MPQLKADRKAPLIPQSEGNGEVKEGNGIKILFPDKLLTKIPVVLGQIKAGNDSSN